VEILITEWALDSYLDLLNMGVFTQKDYWTILRPDVEKLRGYPADPVFQSNSKFWGPADVMGTTIRDGFKMKWHNLGNGRCQLRLPVAIIGNAYLCGAYVKSNPSAEAKALVRFTQHINLIRRGRAVVRGKL
jgi:hypothetical protein